MSLRTGPSASRAILIFGSQVLSFDETAAKQLHDVLHTAEYTWIRETLQKLPNDWQAAAAEVPGLDRSSGAQFLEDLQNWLETASFSTPYPLPNTILTPLVVISHFVQYQQFFDAVGGNIPRGTETLGLCTGLLSAAAASSSKTRAELCEYGRVAIRLAMLIGAVVDAQDALDESKSFSVAWNADHGAELSHILNDFPEAYVSVRLDERRATITASLKCADDLQKKLHEAGLRTHDVHLRGRFHFGEHRTEAGHLLKFCEKRTEYHFSDAKELSMPTRSNTGGEYISTDLHGHVIQSILVEQSDWYKPFSLIQSSIDEALVVLFGKERPVPTSLSRKHGVRFVQLDDHNLDATKLAATIYEFERSVRHHEALHASGIAVIGMSCHLPGANDLDEFWRLLCIGKSQHQEVDPERFTFDTLWREKDPSRKWYGNFIDHYDRFDHKFFKRSPREMSSTDPQQRLMLQTAYHAVEQSGYFHMQQDKHIGCYIGVGLTDYERNVACAPPGAYTATGNLKSFTAGKINHYFGWTGPGLTVDTACSSSAVAIHTACRAILSGECTAALAGGVNVMTSPEWFQNLAGASFLSPTGQCKPFDAKADGYCRGEGAGAVFLKKYSSAIADGDQIYGVIGASMVYQNENCTPITVPNAPSLSTLFGDAMKRAGVDREHISYVEAHGTGTPVGDPAEYEGVRRVLGGPQRSTQLSIGSVKGLVGHLESASGIVALLKTLLMIQHQSIPPQASHDVINPSIEALPSDRIEIARAAHPWVTDFRGALINNYGASGSNACLVVTQSPSHKAARHAVDSASPFWLCANDEQRLREYVARLRNLIKPEISISDLAFQLSRQSNRELRQSLIFSCSSAPELEQTLLSFEQGSLQSSERPATRPIVLCFGGQISKWIGLDKEVYQSALVLRNHLDRCDAVCHEFGLPSIFPGIFQRSPIHDVTALQLMLFSSQYACAKAWIECGIEVAAVIGHSFGELTAMCVAGALTLRDTIKVIAARSRTIKEDWGSDPGAMMAVEGELADVKKLILSSNEQAGEPTEIACYNGKTSFTLAGSTEKIDSLSDALKDYRLKSKRLNVTNAFHSALVEPLKTNLDKIGRSVEFKTPQIPIEHATETEAEQLTTEFVSDHLRDPVYFSHAIERLAKKYPGCVWLEAGSNSTVTTMISRVCGGSKDFHFQPVNISQDGSMRFLVDATLNLWRQGLDVMFWPHHSSQSREYEIMFLPPYQFERAQHWIDLKIPPKATEMVQPQVLERPTDLWTYMGSESERSVRFRINAASQKFQDMVSGHIIAQTAPLCPSTLQLHIAIQTLMSIPPASSDSTLRPQLQGMTSHAPMSIDPTRSIWLDATATDSELRTWDWTMTSNAAHNADSVRHVTGRITFRANTESLLQSEFAQWERMVRFERCHDLLIDSDPDEVMKAPKLYKRFAEIVDYGPTYHGVTKLVGKGDQSAGRVAKHYNRDGWFDTGLGDSFCQVAGMYVNMMTDRSGSEVYISDKIEQWIRSPSLSVDGEWPEDWEVFATHHRPADKKYVSDVFVFDPRNGKLLEVIVGIHYQLVPKVALARVLSKFTQANGAVPSNISGHQPSSTDIRPPPQPEAPRVIQQPVKTTNSKPSKPKESSGPDVSGIVKNIVVNLSGLEPEEIKVDSDLVELGIDSLMAMELGREIDLAFNCSLNTDQFIDLTDFRSLVMLVRETIGLGKEAEVEEDHHQHEPNGTVNGMSNGRLSPSSEEPETSEVMKPKDVQLPSNIVLQAFSESKKATDQFVIDQQLAGYWDTILPKTTELCVVHIMDAFDQLGHSIRDAKAGDRIERIPYLPKHEQFMKWIYDLLEKDARLIDITEDGMFRTSVTAPRKSAKNLLEELNRAGPVHTYDYQLTYLAGAKLADCLTGKLEAIQLIFGSAEGRDIATGMYGKSPINIGWIAQMEDFLKRFLSRVPSEAGPIRILEMGAGTGGTTARLVPLLANLGVPIEYTVTDLSASLVALARKRFKEYPFVKVRVFDIEQGAADLMHSQHLVVATNCVHATHDLVKSTKNIHNVLRPDGFLLMLEMTLPLPWVDLIFGLIEGWWLFDDGRQHALAPAETWDKALHEAGYGYVDWSEGQLPETQIQRIIIAHASAPRYDRAPIVQAAELESTDLAARRTDIDAYTRQFARDFTAPSFNPNALTPSKVALVTGATGSLGSHLVAYLARQPSYERVICLNRRSNAEANSRQFEALASRGITLTVEEKAKLYIVESDIGKPQLGLSDKEYERLLDVTAIIHNAWPMSITRGVGGFVTQFQAMANLVELARRATERRRRDFQFVFQFISSIATIGMHPIRSGKALVPEERMDVGSVLPNGYGDAKLVCEHILDATLRLYPERFRAMAVRIGQIAGSTDSGHWNPVEHLAFLIKSSQTLKLLPGFDGDLSWCPVTTVAATLGDLLHAEGAPHAIYHIENPARQSWRHMVRVLAATLDVPTANIVPFSTWVRRVQQFPGSAADNPAAKLAGFLDLHFVRMSCGGLVMDTKHTQQHSSTLRNSVPVSDELVGRYLHAWKKSGFLQG